MELLGVEFLCRRAAAGYGSGIVFSPCLVVRPVVCPVPAQLKSLDFHDMQIVQKFAGRMTT